MTSKSVVALAAILALGSLSLVTEASAAHDGGGHGGGHFGGGGHFSGGHFSGGHFSGGHFSGGHFGGRTAQFGDHGPRSHFGIGRGGAFVMGGHHRHFWHGRWWDYGVGPCWVWSDVYGEYVWACD